MQIIPIVGLKDLVGEFGKTQSILGIQTFMNIFIRHHGSHSKISTYTIEEFHYIDIFVPVFVVYKSEIESPIYFSHLNYLKMAANF